MRPALLSISVTPASYTYSAICNQPAKQFKATGYYSDSSSRDLTHNVKWHVENNTLAKVNHDGQVTQGCLQGGMTYVDASAYGITGKAVLTSIAG